MPYQGPPERPSELYVGFAMACAFAKSTEDLKSVGSHYKSLIERHGRQDICRQIYKDRFEEIRKGGNEVERSQIAAP
ncbi:hypothetical protein PsAD37_03917 [Pseudovibrio sp. Ad37]|nr:hypothetical protein PsAD37_03917 [Pseudovibrio sp. Ad37]